jgi:hypothetical protein
MAEVAPLEAVPHDPKKEPAVADNEAAASLASLGIPLVNVPGEVPQQEQHQPVEILPKEVQPSPAESVSPPAEEPPAEEPPAEAQPAETQPAEAQPAEAQPAEAQPAEAPPAPGKNSAKKKSGFKGVSWNVQSGKWKSTIMVAGKVTFLGRFHDEEEAARKYDEAAAPLGRPLNFATEEGQRVVKKAVKATSFKGISWDTRVNKWKAQISIGHKAIHLGYFETEEAAARKFDEAASPLGRPLNFPGEEVVKVEGSSGGDGRWSRYKGVRWNGKTSTWVVKIKSASDGKFVQLGSFDDEEAAARAYDASAQPLGMLLNFPPPADPKEPKPPKESAKNAAAAAATAARIPKQARRAPLAVDVSAHVEVSANGLEMPAEVKGPIEEQPVEPSISGDIDSVKRGSSVLNPSEGTDESKKVRYI